MTQNISKSKLNLINVKIGKFKHMVQWLTEAEDLIYTLIPTPLRSEILK